jgi:5-bromo-4-chloroindolyl phosphate hydrolysis protein
MVNNNYSLRGHQVLVVFVVFVVLIVFILFIVFIVFVVFVVIIVGLQNCIGLDRKYTSRSAMYHHYEFTPIEGKLLIVNVI